MLSGLRSRAIAIAFLSFASVPGWAHTSYCADQLAAITPGGLLQLSTARLARAESKAPPPSFDFLELNQHEQVIDDSVPLAFQEAAGDAGLVANKAPGSPSPLTVRPTTQEKSYPVLLRSHFAGSERATVGYVTLPRSRKKDKYQIGAEYAVANVQLHGWGTPSATGANGLEQGEELAKSDIPSLAIDLPGHGMSTRNPDGLLSMKDQVLWIMQQIDQAIHPDVKVNISGHSGGGMLVLMMHQMSREPEYRALFKRVKRFFSISPMIDPSMKGDADYNLAYEDDLAKRLQDEEKTGHHDLRLRMANADFEFIHNMLRNGKDSDVGGVFTTLGAFGFKTAPYTEEMKRDLKPLTVIMGQHDALVYVGYEHLFEEILGKPVGPEAFDPHAHFQFVVLPPGVTWRTRDIQGPERYVRIGHQVADREFEDGPYKGKKQVYTWLGQWLQSMGGTNIQPAPTEDAATKAFGKAFNAYATFFGYRELTANDVEYVETSTADVKDLARRKTELDKYVNAVTKETEKAEREVPRYLEAGRAQLRKELGIDDKIDGDRARAELDLAAKPLSEERRRELEAYREAIKGLDEKLKGTFTDPTSAIEYAKLWNTYADVLKSLERRAGEGDYECYRRHFLSMTERRNKKEKLNPVEAEQYSKLSALHQLVRAVDSGKESRYGIERDRMVNEIPRPAGVGDMRAASRELEIDRSPERQGQLRAFLARVDEVERQARAKAEADLAANILKVDRPEGVTDIHGARRLLDIQNGIMAMTYAPAYSAAEVHAKRIMEAQTEISRLTEGTKLADGTVVIQGVNKLSDQVTELRKRRASLTSRWEAIMKSRPFTSARLASHYADEDSAYAAYEQSHVAYNKKRQWLASLRREGRLTGDNVRALNPELRELRSRFVTARENYMKAAAAATEMEWVEAREGALTLHSHPREGTENVTQAELNEAVWIARQLYGADFEQSRKPGAVSLIKQLADEEQALENVRREIYMLERTRDQAKIDYVAARKEAGEKVPYEVTPVNIYEFLNQPYDVVMEQLRTDPVKKAAFEKMRLRWDPIVKEFRAVNEMKGDNAAY